MHSSEIPEAAVKVQFHQPFRTFLLGFHGFNTSYVLLAGELPEKKGESAQHCAVRQQTVSYSFAKRRMGSYCSWMM